MRRTARLTVINRRLDLRNVAGMPGSITGHERQGGPGGTKRPACTRPLLGFSALFMAMTLVVTLSGVFGAAVRRHLVDRSKVVRLIRKAFAASVVAPWRDAGRGGAVARGLGSGDGFCCTSWA